MPGNFYTVGAQDIASWPVPHYDNPEQRTWLPGFAIFWQVLATIFVVGRLYVRIRNQSGPFGLDDVFIFCAWAFAVAFTGVTCISVWQYDVGRNVWDVRPDKYSGALYWAWIAQVLFINSNGACKTSILLFYRRMAKTSYSRKWLYTVYILLFITVGSWIALFIAWCVMCTPLSTYWSYIYLESIGETNFQCLNGNSITISSGAITIASDLWSAALPCVMFYHYDLGVSKKQKIALNIIFCLGFLVTGCGIARTYYLWQMGHSDNLSYNGYDLFVSSVMEAQLALICTCAPFFRVLLRRFFPDMTNFSRSNRSVIETDNRSSFIMQNPRYNKDTQKGVSLEHVNEKKGFLLVENGAGRPVWNPRDHDEVDHVERGYDSQRGFDAHRGFENQRGFDAHRDFENQRGSDVQSLQSDYGGSGSQDYYVARH